MALPQFQTDIQEIAQMQNTWATQLNPLLANFLVNGQLLKNQALVIGDNSINHKLGRKPQGYIVTGMHGTFSQIYDKPSAMPKSTLVLNSSAVTTIDLWVF